jgi:hypothetical protein
VKWLTRGGLVAALCVGAAVGWGLGWRGLLVLLAFFVSGSLLTQLAGGPGGGGGAVSAQLVRCSPTAAWPPAPPSLEEVRRGPWQ